MSESNDVVFDWSDDNLSLVMSNTGQNGKSQKMRLSWDTPDEIPTKERLVQIYNNYFDTNSSAPKAESYGKTVNLPFNKQMVLGFAKEAEFDNALFRLGNIDITFPITRNNKLVLKAPKITKSDKFGFGAGSSSNAAWVNFRDKK